MIAQLIPRRRGLVEHLDQPDIDPADRERAHRDIERSNLLFGGRRAVLLELRPLFDELAHGVLLPNGAALTTHDDPRSTIHDPRSPLPASATMLDVGTGLADIPWRSREIARRRGVRLRTVGVDGAFNLTVAARHRLDDAICGDAFTLPFADHRIDVVLCSQLLHHFDQDDALRLLAELHRVARRRVIVSDLRRSWLAAAGFWAASHALRFHPITRHDGTISVLRGFTEGELGGMVVAATGVQPAIRRRLGFRLTASWSPTPAFAER